MNLSRRHFLRRGGAAATLPWLASIGGFAHGASATSGPKRLLMICLPLGIYRDGVIPAEEGDSYQSPEYLKTLDEFRDQMTVVSGLDHPGVNGGHSAEPRIFTGVPSHQKNVRSLDQYLAAAIGQQTRYDSLVLSAGRNQFSWTDSGTMVPAESRMARVYAKLFLNEDSATTENVLKEIHQGQSIMDLAQRQAKKLHPHLSRPDQDKLTEYFDSVRETERRLVKAESWVHTPKPEVDLPIPEDPAQRGEIITQLRNVCDISYLAFRTDSTRVITFGYFEQNSVNIEGVNNAYHALSHHGKDPNNIRQLMRIESVFFEELRGLLKKMRDTQEGDASMLDRTTVVVTSNLGNGSNHSNRDLPVLVIGGRYNHGQHLAFEPSTVPLANLYVSILNQFGMTDRSFATSTGPIPDFA